MLLATKGGIVALLGYLFLPLSTSAAFNFVVNQGMWLSPGEWFAGNKVKVYTVVINNNFEQLSGDLEFLANGKPIGMVVVQNVPYEGAKQIGLEYILPAGEVLIEAKLKNVKVQEKDGKITSLTSDQVFGLEVSKKIVIDIDTDNDKKGNLADTDDDNDGLLDDDEVKLGTNVLLTDSDNDSVNDKLEIEKGTDPLKSDTDGDGLSDSEELKAGTDPKNSDSDGDGLSDKKEISLALNPLSRDSDGDGLNDNLEIEKGTNPLVQDTDGDGIKDNEEITKGLNPVLADTDRDGVKDSVDAFPLDAKESTDKNKNGRGDNFEEQENIVELGTISQGTSSTEKMVSVQEGAIAGETDTSTKENLEPSVQTSSNENISDRQYKIWFIGGGILSFIGFLIFSALYATKKRESDEW